MIIILKINYNELKDSVTIFYASFDRIYEDEGKYMKKSILLRKDKLIKNGKNNIRGGSAS